MNINNNHIEVIVGRMMRWVNMEEVGDTEFLIEGAVAGPEVVCFESDFSLPPGYSKENEKYYKKEIDEPASSS